jgi:hypothetical protein
MQILARLAIIGVGVFWYYSGLLKKPGQRTKRNAFIALAGLIMFVIGSGYCTYELWPWGK